jgi:GTP-binding protein HflX
MSKKVATLISQMHPKTLAVGVYTPYVNISDAENYFEEFLSLIKTLGMPYDETWFTKARVVDYNTFFTKGKLEEFKLICDQKDIEVVIFSEQLNPLQERNLEDFIGCSIMDREQLILEIFKKSAHTAEGKIQVEMAEINFLRTRIIGKGVEYSQQLGVIGTKGPGETATEKMRRVFADKLRQAKQKLETLQKARENQRKRRLSSNIPQLCIVGYTNAGKSSLLNILTKSTVLIEDKLFATLDTTTREYFVGGKTKVLISDTVGFISQLPHNLVEAFKSTLEELKFADLLLHVVDASNAEWRSQIQVVNETIKNLGVEKPMLYVFNKIDKLSQEELEPLKQEFNEFQPHILIHTKSKEGVKQLVDFLLSNKI